MARQPRRRSNRNLKSSGWELARFTGRTLDKTATTLFHWLTTDDSGMTRMYTLMPQMELLDSVKMSSRVSLLRWPELFYESVSANKPPQYRAQSSISFMRLSNKSPLR